MKLLPSLAPVDGVPLMRIFLTALLTSYARAFNLDTTIPMLKDGLLEEQFGFSVALSKVGNPLIIGAPKTNQTVPPHFLSNNTMTEAEFAGDVVSSPADYSTDNARSVIGDFKALLEYLAQGDPHQVANNMRFGMSIDTRDNQLLACAPKTAVYRTSESLETGICYTLEYTRRKKAYKVMRPVDPCYNLIKTGRVKDKNGWFSYCSAGFSAAFLKSSSLVVGAPGGGNWRGALFVYKPEKPPTGRDGARTLVQLDKSAQGLSEVERENRNILGTHSWLGFSVDSSERMEPHNPEHIPLYVSGAPHSKGVGQVVLSWKVMWDKRYTANRVAETEFEGLIFTDPEHIISGEKYASNFGAAVCVVDLNADTYDDLVVGAPMYGDKGERYGGAIYVYMNDGKGVRRDTAALVITGQDLLKEIDNCKTAHSCVNAQFGSSIARIGDVNMDGYEDIAVGAPFEDKDEMGAVYIFLGSKNGLVKKFSQRIQASQLPKPSADGSPIKWFGYSIAGGMDVDANGNPDILVSAPGSARVALIRARGIIKLDIAVDFQPAEINPDHRLGEEPRCDLPDKLGSGYPNQYQCFRMSIRVSWTTKYPDKFLGFRPKVNMTYSLDRAGRKFSRAWFYGKSQTAKNQDERSVITKSLTLKPHGEVDEIIENAYVENGIRDLNRALTLNVSIELNQKEPKYEDVSKQQTVPKINELYPILDASTATKVFELPFKKDCGADKKCISQLMLWASLSSDRSNTSLPWNMINGERVYELSEGEVNEPVIFITVRNLAEPAYDLKGFLETPDMITFKEQIFPEVSAKTSAKLRQCDPASDGQGNVTCIFNSPFPQGETSFAIVLEANYSSRYSRNFSMTFSLATSSQTVRSVMVKTFKLRVVQRAEISIDGVSRPDTVWYGGPTKGVSAMTKEDQIGHRVEHSYEVFNKGPSVVPRLSVDFQWPYQVENNEKIGPWLFYLMETPLVLALDEETEVGRCLMEPGQVNPLKLKKVNTSDTVAYTEPSVVKSRTASVIKLKGKEEEKDETPPAADAGERVKSRQRREATVGAKREGPANVVRLDCAKRTARCLTFKCEITSALRPGESAVIKLRARVWNSTFVRSYRYADRVYVSSRATVTLDPGAQERISQLNTEDDTESVITELFPDFKILPKKGVDYWIYIVAAIGGLLILIIIVLVLWRLGFFKRKRPSEEMYMHAVQVKKAEKEPVDEYKFTRIHDQDT